MNTLHAEDVRSILVIRLDVHGDVLVATSVLPGLHAKYPNAYIDWYVRTGYDFALKHNPYIRRIIPGPLPDQESIFSTYDKTINIEHHYRWNKPMAKIHCEIAGVPFHRPELFFTQEELAEVPVHHRNRIVVANNAGWKSRTCPNLNLVLHKIATDDFLQIDKGHRMSSRIERCQCSLREAAAIMYYAKLYIGIDTVFMHMAVALGKPMVLFLGPTGPETQYIPNSVYLRPCVWLTPPIPNPAFSDGIQLPQEAIRKLIRRVLKTSGEVKPIPVRSFARHKGVYVQPALKDGV